MLYQGPLPISASIKPIRSRQSYSVVYIYMQYRNTYIYIQLTNTSSPTGGVRRCIIDSSPCTFTCVLLLGEKEMRADAAALCIVGPYTSGWWFTSISFCFLRPRRSSNVYIYMYMRSRWVGYLPVYRYILLYIHWIVSFARADAATARTKTCQTGKITTFTRVRDFRTAAIHMDFWFGYYGINMCA